MNHERHERHELVSASADAAQAIAGQRYDVFGEWVRAEGAEGALRAAVERETVRVVREVRGSQVDHERHERHEQGPARADAPRALSGNCYDVFGSSLRADGAEGVFRDAIGHELVRVVREVRGFQDDRERPERGLATENPAVGRIWAIGASPGVIFGSRDAPQAQRVWLAR